MGTSRTLPPLPALLAFEAAAATENFSLAARQLGQSQAAVSQHVAALERFIGQPLFRRLHRGVALTEAGKTLRAALARGFDLIESTLEDLSRTGSAPALTIATDFGFATFWLMPRLEALGTALPGVEVRLITGQQAPRMAMPECDVTIAFGAANLGGEFLFPEEVVPVCSPAFLTRHRRPDGSFDWTRLPLLELDAPEPDRWMAWTEWLSASGLPPRPARAPVLHLNTYPLAVEAAMLGQGAALGWQPLLARHLAAGSLVAMSEKALKTERAYRLLISRQAAEKPAVAGFRRWLLSAV
ncbi:LysR family transcriptional regulator [Acidisoma cellulosilytica]|uniref:LysR family transcriptional regulator n=1 Tax=Acidisoma cellulosilyticum TaxID=2802395 RepID=A0A963Z023_9PROT|nr:LysR substrate-binding domain-containing protein [Acidisoma cellulosilyticum]MCB8880044.1 LysR family transcriptional regulator [Acidisoma cellulosilyticum]